MSADTTRQVTVSYGPGSSTALVMDDLWLLADATPDDATITDVWQSLLVSPHGDVASDIATLVGTNRGFVLAQITDGVLIVTVSGEGRVGLGAGDNVDTLTCPQSLALAEYRFRDIPGAIALEIDADGGGTLLPFTAGVVPAGRLHVAWSSRSDAAKHATVRNGSSDGVHLSPEGVSGETVQPSAIGGATLMAPNEADLLGVVESDAEADVAPESAPVLAAQPGADSGYDYLFGHTVHRSVGDAAVHPVGDPEPPSTRVSAVDAPADEVRSAGEGTQAQPGNSEPASIASEPETPTPVVPTGLPSGPGPIVRAKDTGMIDSVPWAHAGVAAAAPGTGRTATADPASEVEASDEVLGLTVSRAQLKEMTAAAGGEAAGGGPTTSGPPVHAVRCPAGHPNPAHAELCRVCREPIAEQSPITLPRPVLGVLRFSTGDVITLDRGVLIGRKPSKSRMHADDRPHMVKIPSPDQDISRDHVEIRLDDWHVLVTDLNSTNGTVVTRPGREPERLRPEQATLIDPGTVVTLADVVTFTFETTD